jgi:hypothetical protein
MPPPLAGFIAGYPVSQSGLSASSYFDKRSQKEMDVVVEINNRRLEGWGGDTVFELTNGQKRRQVRYAYRYAYKYTPRVKILRTAAATICITECLPFVLPILGSRIALLELAWGQYEGTPRWRERFES